MNFLLIACTLKTPPPKTVLHVFLLWILMATHYGWSWILDTGVSANRKHNSPLLCPCNVCLKAYGDQIITRKHKVTLTCKANQREHTLDFYVAVTKAPPILGLQASDKLGLVEKLDCPQEQPKQGRPAVDAVTSASCTLTKADVLEEFHDVFTGLGKFD